MGLAAANFSVEKFSLHSSLFIKETDVSRNFTCSLGNVSLNIGGPAKWNIKVNIVVSVSNTQYLQVHTFLSYKFQLCIKCTNFQKYVVYSDEEIEVYF